MSKIVMYNGKPFKFQIWDTAGQEKYRGLAPMYYRGASAAVLVYDITSKLSFLSLKSWKSELDVNGPEKLVITVVGNKCDLEEKRAVSPEVCFPIPPPQLNPHTPNSHPLPHPPPTALAAAFDGFLTSSFFFLSVGGKAIR